MYAVRCLIFASHPHDFHHYIMIHKLPSVMIMIMIMISIESMADLDPIDTIRCCTSCTWID